MESSENSSEKNPFYSMHFDYQLLAYTDILSSRE